VIHKDLVEISRCWLKGIGCSVIITEQSSVFVMEKADAIGWYSSTSILVECKTSLSDFKNDQYKIARQTPELALGNWRVYLCENNVIPKKLIPKGWGLVYYCSDTSKFKRIIGLPNANQWYLSPFESNLDSEKALLLAYIRKSKRLELE